MEVDEALKNALLKCVKEETIPAIGCTEPVAVAYAAAAAKKYLKGDINSMQVFVSLNIFKNGKSVLIPNANECGLKLAAALGALSGNTEDGLCIFKNVNEAYINAAHKMINDEKIKLTYKPDAPDIYVEILLKDEKDNVNVILSGGHTHITKVEVNGRTVYEDAPIKDKKTSRDFLKDMNFKELREISEKIDIDELKFISDGIEMNKKAAESGLKKDYGLRWGASLLKLNKEGKIKMDSSMKARILTAAGADFRMGGGNCPIMTSGGSGNQGLGVILPITVVGEEINAPNERVVRAIFFGHAINNFVKVYTGKLSSICGCAIAAGIGASAGIAWLLGGDDEEIEGAVNNMLANLTGMLCDGAKESCACKLSTSAGEAVLSAYLACEGTIVNPKIGILGGSAEESIKNIGRLCREGFNTTDDALVNIMNQY